MQFELCFFEPKYGMFLRYCILVTSLIRIGFNSFAGNKSQARIYFWHKNAEFWQAMSSSSLKHGLFLVVISLKAVINIQQPSFLLSLPNTVLMSRDLIWLLKKIYIVNACVSKSFCFSFLSSWTQAVDIGLIFVREKKESINLFRCEIYTTLQMQP
jgi:hypothetical protein